MEKRFRDYLRHLEKLDFDVIFEEEIWEERDGLELKLTEIHQEMVRMLIPMMTFLICACIFLAVGFATNAVASYVAAAVMALAAAYVSLKYRTLGTTVRKLCVFVDKLTAK